MKEFNLGQVVYFCHCYGEGWGNKPYRWGRVKLGFITSKEYIEARNSYIYTVGTLTDRNNLVVTYKTLGPHLIFDYTGYAEALEKIGELCAEADD